MARGLPAVWSTLVGLPFVIVGGYVYVAYAGNPQLLGIPFMIFGGFIVIIGVYIHFVAAPEPPRMRENEKIVDSRHPTQRVAVAKLLTSIPFWLIAMYLMFFTGIPYVYPIVAFLLGLYFVSSGLYTYWTNCLTTYYVTTRRIMKEYRFLSLIRQELPLDKIRGVEERKSLTETIVGLGNVRVASGGGGTLEVVIRNIETPTEFADNVRELL